MISVVYNSRQYAIVAYPAHEAFELVDKACSRSLFVQGSVAGELRRAIESIPDEQRCEVPARRRAPSRPGVRRWRSLRAEHLPRCTPPLPELRWGRRACACEPEPAGADRRRLTVRQVRTGRFIPAVPPRLCGAPARAGSTCCGWRP